jgi:hypothetical protein
VVLGIFAPKGDDASLLRYAPLASVWDGDDAKLLERLLGFYPRARPKRILDATVNGGRFWRGSSRPVIGMDIEAAQRPMLVGDNTHMPFREGTFDVVVYAPPHIPNQGKDKSKDFNTRFGLVLRSSRWARAIIGWRWIPSWVRPSGEGNSFWLRWGKGAGR